MRLGLNYSDSYFKYEVNRALKFVSTREYLVKSIKIVLKPSDTLDLNARKN